mmetsp:Transcript_35110/g.76862  ORF Transcript_35110/g.76862 Transcript_35110/m.76862 type:complete len:190 (+) Transcript_35110:68-637(+)
MGDFGDLVLVCGDHHIPGRAADLPVCFKELLNTDKIKTILCTGNVGSDVVAEQLKDQAANVHIVKGDFDFKTDWPESVVVNVGAFKVGLIHGHQVLPWGDPEALHVAARKLDVDILVSGHTHIGGVQELNGKYFINPGSITGAHAAHATEDVVPSFMLMAIQGQTVVLYTYKEEEGKANVVMSKLEPQR